MRVPAAWLRSYCDPGLEVAEIADVLTMAGVKLERLHRVGVGDPSAFVVGRVLEAERHPNADRLSVCRVDDGSGEARTIVCGAPNVVPGQTVAVALPGAVMPDGTELGEPELRGVRSSGMILAEHELGVGEDHSGILVLDDGFAAGTQLTQALPIVDEVIEIEVSPTGPTPWGCTGWRATCTPPAAPRSPRTPPPPTPSQWATITPTTTRASRSPTRKSACASPRACSRTSRSVPRRRGSSSG
jgi:phenylalanyl-tRNA synthetase beta chain